ncbi:MAG: PIN domain-containing protein [Candidatus Korarchaeota archaeon]|nr:PIN domain-containing protein [Candidatus Korarchaeota archaeon]
MRWMMETDLIISAIFKGDPNHDLSKRVLKGSRRFVPSPYTLMELGLLIRSGNIEVEDYPAFWSSFEKLLEQYDIGLIPMEPSHFAEAERIRITYDLSYFDSLHAAVAMNMGGSP